MMDSLSYRSEKNTRLRTNTLNWDQGSKELNTHLMDEFCAFAVFAACWVIVTRRIPGVMTKTEVKAINEVPHNELILNNWR